MSSPFSNEEPVCNCPCATRKCLECDNTFSFIPYYRGSCPVHIPLDPDAGPEPYYCRNCTYF